MLKISTIHPWIGEKFAFKHNDLTAAPPAQILKFVVEAVMPPRVCFRAGTGVSSWGFELRSKLQYAYSISVFVGVLMTTYLMMNRDSNANLPFRGFQSPTVRSEGTLVDPALNSLFEMEDALEQLPDASRKSNDKKIRRAPSGRPRHYFIR